MVEAAWFPSFLEALVGFEPTYPAKEFPFKGTGFSHFPTAPARTKSQQSCAFGAFDGWLLRFMF
jgi:hypothetical protein